jgi:hypothetical protein
MDSRIGSARALGDWRARAKLAQGRPQLALHGSDSRLNLPAKIACSDIGKDKKVWVRHLSLMQKPLICLYFLIMHAQKNYVSKAYPMESSAKTQHFQWLQAHGYGLALDSMGQFLSFRQFDK